MVVSVDGAPVTGEIPVETSTKAGNRQRAGEARTGIKGVVVWLPGRCRRLGLVAAGGGQYSATTTAGREGGIGGRWSGVRGGREREFEILGGVHRLHVGLFLFLFFFPNFNHSLLSLPSLIPFYFSLFSSFVKYIYRFTIKCIF